MKQWKPIALGFGIASFAILSYALVGRQDDGISANNHSVNPPSFPSGLASSRVETVTVPAGTKVHIRLKEAISPEKNSSGDYFLAKLHGPLIVGAKLLAPSRCKIIGQHTQIQDSGQVGGRALPAMLLRKLVVNGKEYDLDTKPLTLLAIRTKKKAAAVIAASDPAEAENRTGTTDALSRGRLLAVQEGPVAYEPESQFTFTLSSPLELPVIRKMGSIETLGGA